MANGKNGTSKLAIVAGADMTDKKTELLNKARELGAAKSKGDASWEGVADLVMDGCESGTWSEINFTDNTKSKVAAERNAENGGALLIDAFYDGAVSAVKSGPKLVKPKHTDKVFAARLSNLRAIGKASCKHEAKFRSLLRGTGGIVSKRLVDAVNAKPAKGTTYRKPYGAFEVIYNTARAALKQDSLDKFADNVDVDKLIYPPAKTVKTDEQETVDAIGKMVADLKKITGGWKEKDGTEHAAVADKELTDAYKSLGTWFANNAAKGTPKKGKSKGTTVADVKLMPKAELELWKASILAALGE